MITTPLLDLLDEYMDIIRDHVLDPVEHVALCDAYWQVRQRVDAWRDELQVAASTKGEGE